MKLKKITFSGIDEEVEIQNLISLSEAFKETISIEWGVLLSPKNGRPRYPSLEWIEKLAKPIAKNKINAAGHLCGKFAKTFIQGSSNELPLDLDMFDRIQINLGPYIEESNEELIYNSIRNQNYNCFILQVGNNYDKTIEIAKYLKKRLCKIELLYDCSGGNGIEQSSWPQSHQDFVCGFAGGLSPENISEKLNVINHITNNKPFWIDMESGIRTDNSFNLEKVINILETIAKLDA